MVIDLSASHGLTSTSQEFQNISIDYLSVKLEDLLVKPGKSVLSQLNKLSDHLGWHNKVVLDARFSKVDKEGMCVIKSRFDGSRIKVSMDDVIALILSLKPNIILLQGNQINQEMLKQLSQLAASLFVTHKGGQSMSPCNSHQFYETNDRPTLEFGDFWMPSDIMSQSCDGLVYSNAGLIDIKESSYEHAFEPLSDHCECPTCQQGFTKSYLHHLFHHTPLLSFRYLVQHNVFNILG